MRHFVETMVSRYGDLPADDYLTIKQEFIALDYEGTTVWLSTFLNGLRTCLFETYVARGILGRTSE